MPQHELLACAQCGCFAFSCFEDFAIRVNTVLQTILNVVDHDMNAQAAVDAGRIHHQWLPDRIRYERQMFSPDTLHILTWLGHNLDERTNQGSAHVIVVDQQDEVLEGGVDRRSSTSVAAFY